MTKRKNVVIFVETQFPPVSRANLRMYYLGRSLARKGYLVRIISPSNAPFRREKNRIIEGIGILQFPGFNRFIYSRMRVVVRFWNIISSVLVALYLNKKERINVIHAWNPIAGLAAIMAGKLVSCPVYLDFTDFYSDIAKCDAPFFARLLKVIERFILISAARIFIVSEEMRKILVNWGIEESKVYIVPDGTDSTFFHPDVDGSKIRFSYGLSPGQTIIYSGDIKYHDGVDILFHALAKVIKDFPKVKLILLGKFSWRSKRRLTGLIQKLNIQKFLVQPGWVSHSQVPQYLAAADVGVLPSRPTLNNNCYLSFKLFEYWAVGKPVVVSNLRAISQVVKNDVNGIIVPPEDADALAKAIVEIFRSPKKGKEMGRKGRELVKREYSWPRIMEKEVSLYSPIP